jgi:hypothetical protein
MAIRKSVFLLLATVGLFLVTFLSAGAQADTLTYTPTPVGVGQTSNNPCIIGDPSCDTNTKQTFPLVYTSASGPCKGGNCDFNSPVYVASDSGLGLPNIIPTSFDVGADENLGTGQGPEVLQHFYVWLCNSSGKNCTTLIADLGSPSVLVDEHNGTGFTDGIISQINLTSGNKYKFEAVWTNDTDGMEQFWIIPGTPVGTPEPNTLSLLGIGVLSVAALSLRKAKA